MEKLTLKEIRRKNSFKKAMRLMKKFSVFSLAHTYGEKSALKMGGKFISQGISAEQAKYSFDRKIFNVMRNALIKDYPDVKYMSNHEMLNMILNGSFRKNLDM